MFKNPQEKLLCNKISSLISFQDKNRFHRAVLAQNAIKSFQRAVWAHYRKYGRNDLPWRKTRDPYKILISEIMLQQTQVGRVREKYPQFLVAFPAARALAAAPVSRVLKEWQGMGYNRRALALKKIAQELITRFGGKVPKSSQALISLPGIGKATAGAIMAFAFNLPAAFIETNIRRAFIHFFFSRKKAVDDKEILELAQKALDRRRPREWYWALMDYGAMLGGAVKNPNRRSRRYQKQSAFEGSNRQVRSKILKLLLSEGPMNKKQINSCISDPRLFKNLVVLRKEGFIKKEKGKYKIES